MNLPCMQLAFLTRLYDLTLYIVEHGSKGYDVLAQLGGCMERLRFISCSWCGACATGGA